MRSPAWLRGACLTLVTACAVTTMPGAPAALAASARPRVLLLPFRGVAAGRARRGIFRGLRRARARVVDLERYFKAIKKLRLRPNNPDALSRGCKRVRCEVVVRGRVQRKRVDGRRAYVLRLTLLHAPTGATIREQQISARTQKRLERAARAISASLVAAMKAFEPGGGSPATKPPATTPPATKAPTATPAATTPPAIKAPAAKPPAAKPPVATPARKPPAASASANASPPTGTARATVAPGSSRAIKATVRMRSASRGVRLTPERIVLGRTPRATIDVALAGSGTPHAIVNVGAVTSIKSVGERVVIGYRSPTNRAPQVLVAIVWRDGGAHARVFRVPLIARTVIPIRTRSHTKVVVAIGRYLFGPRSTGRSGRVRMRVLVPPGVTIARVRATDKAGLTTRKRIHIEPPAYPTIALVVRPVGNRQFRVLAADANGAAPLSASVRTEGGSGRSDIALTRGRDGLWGGTWSSPAAPRAVRYALEVKRGASAVAGEASARSVVVNVPANATLAAGGANGSDGKDALAVRRAPDDPRAGRSARWRVGLGFGVLSNLGALTSPRFSLETSLLFALGSGWLGARVGLGIGWASQDISDGGLRASSSLVLLPIAIGAHYELPLGRFAPYANLSFVLAIVANKNAVEAEPEQTHVDVAPGLLALAGCAMRLGPGSAFLEAGWQQSRIDTPQVDALVGGLLISGGFRLELR